jgi:signal transduction histidine kinase
VVDDVPANLHVLAAMLKERGYEARPVPSGRLALEAARNDPPDLVLLDVNMPEMNGYEVCERLKAEPRLAEIPVIFISASTETLDKVQAFARGGVDYVTKPFQFEEIQARVAAHLKIRNLQLGLEARNRELAASLDRLRQLEALRDSLVHMIIHDLRSPLSVVRMSLDMAMQEAGNGNLAVAAADIRRAQQGARKMGQMVNNLLDVSRLEAGQMKLRRSEWNLVAVVREVLAELVPLAEGRLLVFEPTQEAVQVAGDREIVGRILQNLLGNALKFTPDPGEIRTTIEADEAGVRVSIADTGPGIAAEHHQKIFEKFAVLDGRPGGASTGLGLAFCRLAMEAHGGQLGVESEPGRGSTFWFVLPAAARKAP